MTAATRGDAQGLAVLNLDDNEAIRYAKTRTLLRGGYRVLEAATGSEALAVMGRERPPLALLDVKLPDMSGIEVCQIIKRDYPETRVMQISATHISAADKVKGLNSGADVYLVQPVEPDELLAAAGALLRVRGAESELRKENQQLVSRVAERTQELADTNRALRTEVQERQRVEAALLQAQKMEAVGQLTGGIAHDFNNLLMAIMGNLQIMKRRLDQGRSDVDNLADNAMEAAQRAAALTQRLLSFARRHPLSASRVDVSEVMDGLSGMLRTTIGERIAVTYEPGADLAPVLCDPHQLENAILNLVINARDAMPDGGVIAVSADNLEVSAKNRTAFPDLAPGPYVRVAVSDTGEGMPPDVIDRAFDPFFTTKPVGRGTGLGLSMLYSFVRQSGGAVSIESQPGLGATVAMLLPRAGAGAVAVGRTAEPALRGAAAGETILLVEDEVLVRQLVVEALAERGYRCLEAGDAQEALAIVASGAEFDLLLTDVGLPGTMNGVSLAEAVRLTRPGLKVLFATGHATVDDGTLAGAEALTKPFDLDDLARRVRAVLDATPG